jgi:two-component system response regulator NreC
MWWFWTSNYPIAPDWNSAGISGRNIPHPGADPVDVHGEEYIFKAIAQGASGYRPKTPARKNYRQRSGHWQKERFLQPVISEIMLSGYVKKAKSNQTSLQSLHELTKREVAILTMIADGITHQDIADKLFISVRTVESHKSHIMQKLDLHTTAELVKFAIRQKLIEI